MCVSAVAPVCRSAHLKVPVLDKLHNQIVKCSMCAHRNLGQDAKAIPACVEVCPTNALEFGKEAHSGQGATDG